MAMSNRVLRPLQRERYEELGMVPWEELPKEQRFSVQLKIEMAFATGKVPSRWVSVAFAEIRSRAWSEWYARLGKNPSNIRDAIPKATRDLVLLRDGFVCGICGKSVQESEIHLDHIVPVSHGGGDEPENLQVTHASCNLKKGNRV